MRGGTYEYGVGLNATWYQKCDTLPEFQSSLTFAVFLSAVIREVSGGLSSQSGSTSMSLSVDIAILLSWKVTFCLREPVTLSR